MKIQALVFLSESMIFLTPLDKKRITEDSPKYLWLKNIKPLLQLICTLKNIFTYFVK